MGILHAREAINWKTTTLDVLLQNKIGDMKNVHLTVVTCFIGRVNKQDRFQPKTENISWLGTTKLSANLKSLCDNGFRKVDDIFTFEPQHEISNNVVCATSKGSDQPAHTRSLIRAFASRLNIL